MPSTAGSFESSVITRTTCSVVVCAGSSTCRDSMPTSAQRLRFIRTWEIEAGLSPTITAAKQGEVPVRERNSAARSAQWPWRPATAPSRPSRPRSPPGHATGTQPGQWPGASGPLHGSIATGTRFKMQFSAPAMTESIRLVIETLAESAIPRITDSSEDTFGTSEQTSASNFGESASQQLFEVGSLLMGAWSCPAEGVHQHHGFRPGVVGVAGVCLPEVEEAVCDVDAEPTDQVGAAVPHVGSARPDAGGLPINDAGHASATPENVAGMVVAMDEHPVGIKTRPVEDLNGAFP